MAVRTEDHPYDYGSFDGVIPEGYAAGIVMPWGHGSWIPEVDDVAPRWSRATSSFRLTGTS